MQSSFVVLALGLWILGCSASLTEDDDAKALNQQVDQLIEQGKYQEAIPIAEKALEAAKRVLGAEHPETAEALNNLGLLCKKTGSYAKAESLYLEALRIFRKVLGEEHSKTAETLTNPTVRRRTRVRQSRTAPSRSTPNLTKELWARRPQHNAVPD